MMFYKVLINDTEYKYYCTSCTEYWVLDEKCYCNQCRQYKLPLTHCPKCGIPIEVCKISKHG